MNIDQLIYEFEPLSQPKPGFQYMPMTGTAKIPDMKQEGWDGAMRGKVSFEIPLKDYTGDFKFRAKLVANAKYKGWDYVEFGSRIAPPLNNAPDSVMVGDIFDVSFKLPSELEGTVGARRYFIMSGDEVKFDDVMLIQGRLDQDRFRYDIEPIEEKIEGNTLTAKLQITNMDLDKLLGGQKLVMMWFKPGESEMDMTQMLNKAGEALAGASAALDAGQPPVVWGLPLRCAPLKSRNNGPSLSPFRAFVMKFPIP